MRPFGEDGAFRHEVASQQLRHASVKGAGATVFAGGITLAVQMIGTIVLARLLSPSDFGLVAMVTTFSLLLINFGMNGFTDAILQKHEINRSLVSNLFWINIGAGSVLTLGFASTGSLLAVFYGEPRVRDVTVGMSLTILFTTLSVQHLALMKRAMRFSVVSLNEVVARILSVVVSLFLAFLGWSYWALVVGAITQSACLAIGAWSVCRWIPSFPKRVPGTWSMVRFAMHAYGRFIANYCTWNADNLLVGWRFGPMSLGYYKKAYDLFALPASQLVTPVANVAVSALSRLKENPEQYRSYFLRAIGVIAFVSMALSADLTLVGRDVIRLILGSKWAESGRIFVYFGPGIGMMLLYYTNGWLHVSQGRADRWLRWGVVEFGGTVALFVLALRWGSAGVALAWTASFWLLTFPALWYAGLPIKLRPSAVLAVIWRYVMAAMVGGVVTFLLMRTNGEWMELSDWKAAAVHMVLSSLLFVLFYLGAVVAMHRGYSRPYNDIRLMLEMLPFGRVMRHSPESALPAPTGLVAKIGEASEAV